MLQPVPGDEPRRVRRATCLYRAHRSVTATRASIGTVDDVVAVEVTTDSGETGYFLTWGRIQSAIESAPLEALALRAAASFSWSGRPVKARVCATLREAADEPYFYEELLALARQPIPFGNEYEEWHNTKAARMEDGKEFHYLGRRGRA